MSLKPWITTQNVKDNTINTSNTETELGAQLPNPHPAKVVPGNQVLQKAQNVIQSPETDSIESYRKMVEDCKPVKLHKGPDDKIDYIETPAGNIPGPMRNKPESLSIPAADEENKVTVIDGVRYRTIKNKVRKPGEVITERGDSLSAAFDEAVSYD